MKHFIGIIILWLLATEAFAAPPPRHAVPLETYTADSPPSEKFIRLRIGVATNFGTPERSVRVGDVLLCHAADCFRAHTSGFIDLTDTSTGSASVIADVVIPVMTITDIYFSEIVGKASIAGHIRLPKPIVIEEGFHGLQLLIGLDPKRSRNGLTNRVTYAPTGSGNVYFNNESELVHYLPPTQTIAKLSLGTTLTIPRGALSGPQVFNIGIHDRGDTYPSIDIFPYLTLKMPATVETDPIAGGRFSSDVTAPVGLPGERHIWGQPDDTRPPRRGRVTLMQTGLVEPSALVASHPGRPGR